MPSTTTQVVVAEVLDVSYTYFTIFPLRCCFNKLSESVVQRRELTYDRIKFCCRESVDLWSTSDQSHYRDTVTQRAQTMQERRTAGKLLSILDLAAQQVPITRTRQLSDMEFAVRRASQYDEEAFALRSLYGALPAWQKQLPAVALIYMRTAVKAIQRRLFLLAGEHSGAVSEVWANYVMGSTSIEIDGVCDKVDKYFKKLREFVMMNSYLPDIEDSPNQSHERKEFQGCLKMCRLLLQRFNEAVPIVYALDTTLRDRLQHSWIRESGQDLGWVLRASGKDVNTTNALFAQTSQRVTSSFFNTLKDVSNLATETSDELNVIASCQVSVIASAHLACSLIARKNYEDLASFGHSIPVTAATGTGRQSDKSESSAQTSCTETEKVRNNHLQVDVLSMWTAIVVSDQYLEKELVTSQHIEDTSILNFSDQWYNQLFARIVAPDIFFSLMAGGGGKDFKEACSRLMRSVHKAA